MGCFFRFVEISLHYLGAVGDQFALFSHGHFHGTGFDVHKLDTGALHRNPHRTDLFDSLGRIHTQNGAGFRHAVNLQDFTFSDNRLKSLDGLHRKRRSSGYTALAIRKIEGFEFGFFHQYLVKGWNIGHQRGTILLDFATYVTGIPGVRDQALGNVFDQGRHADHQPCQMKQGKSGTHHLFAL